MYKKYCLLLIISFSIVLLFTSTTYSLEKTSNQNENISLNNQEFKQGEIIRITVKNNQSLNKIIFNNNNYKPKTKNNEKIILIPISYWLQPGEYELIIKTDYDDINKIIKILSGDFEESHITVDSEQEETIRPEQPKTIERRKNDSALINKARQISSPKKLWQNEFIWPVKGPISSPFGATRYVNGKLQNRHSGIDIAVPEGKKVKACANGIVKLGTDLLVTGNTIIIDHGWNISSSYCHLQDIYVEPGTEVEQGDIIGTVGSTGFSTGPHLHWGINVNGVFVNPELFIDRDILD